MAVTPTGIFSLQVSKMRDLLASCASFQAWAGVPGNEAASLLKIKFVRVDAADVPDGFHAAVFPPEGAEYGLDGLSSGELIVGIKADITEADEGDAFFEFSNPLGDVVVEMFEKSQASGFMVLRRVRAIFQHSGRSDEGTAFYFTELSFNYGLESGGI